MQVKRRPQHSTSWKSLGVIGVTLILFGAYISTGLASIGMTYDTVLQELQKPVYSGDLKRVTLGDSSKVLHIASWRSFSPGSIWGLVSKSERLPESFVPQDLITTTLDHGDADTDMRISSKIAVPLQSLFDAAKGDGLPLMISSSYRSVSDQEALYNQYVRTQGESSAKQYVAEPGTSEHHTGLAIDLSDYSLDCADDSDACSISTSASAWLAENAHKYGFINRYPDGKQSITGILYEPWHYRYVGVELAKKIYDSGLTLDEALEIMRPAYSS